jgi:hypothetical protein
VKLLFLTRASPKFGRIRRGACSALVIASSAGCGGFAGSPDNPNGDDSGRYYGTAIEWRVTDTANDSVLASGCRSEPPNPTLHAATGKRLLFETAEKRVTKSYSESDPGWWCNDEALIARSPAGIVDNLACWTLAEAGSLVVVEWEAVPSPIDLGRPAADKMKGQGFRMLVDVLEHGSLVLEPSGTCRVEPLRVLSVLE